MGVAWLLTSSLVCLYLCARVDGMLDFIAPKHGVCATYSSVRSLEDPLIRIQGMYTGDFRTERRFQLVDADGDGDEDVIFVFANSITRMILSGAASPTRHNTLALRVLTRSGVTTAWGASVRVDCVADCGIHAGYSSLYVVGGRVLSGSLVQRLGFPDNYATYNVSVWWPDHDQSTWDIPNITPASLSRRVITVAPPEAFHLTLVPAGYDASAGPPVAGLVTTLTFRIAIRGLATSVASCFVDGVDLAPTSLLSADASNFTVRYTTTPGNLQWPWDGFTVTDCVVVSDDGQHGVLQP